MGKGFDLRRRAQTSANNVSPGINLLNDSWDFTSATDWNGGPLATEALIYGSQNDPFGTNHAYLWVEQSGGASMQLDSSTITIPGYNGVVCFSGHIKTAAPTSFSGRLELVNVTKSTYRYIQYQANTSYEFAMAGSSAGVTYGIEALASQWYRAYGSFDMSSVGWDPGDTLLFRIIPWLASTGIVMVLTGMQVEPGSTPGTYKEKP